MSTITIPITRPPMTSNGQRRAHWTEVRRAKAEVEQLVAWHSRRVTPITTSGYDKVHISIVWFAPDRRRRDPDCLSVFGKGAIDTLVKLGYLADDSWQHVHAVSYRIEPASPDPRIEITLTESQVSRD